MNIEHIYLIILTPLFIDSKIYSDVTSKVRSKKNAPRKIVAANVDVLLKTALYKAPAPAIFAKNVLLTELPTKFLSLKKGTPTPRKFSPSQAHSWSDYEIKIKNNFLVTRV